MATELGPRPGKLSQPASRPFESGGGSLPGTSPSEMCSVHSVPDQNRCSWRKKGSLNHPGGVPVVVTVGWEPLPPACGGGCRPTTP